MRRGIHLRQLRNRDLTNLGLAPGRVPEPESPTGQVRLREVDPAMGERVAALRAELEEVLAILVSALTNRDKDP